GGAVARRLVARIAVVRARDRVADRVLEVRVALEAQLLAELDHAGLADAQGVGQLLRGVVAQQLGVVEHEVGDAALDRRHLVPFSADLDQRRHAPESPFGLASGAAHPGMGSSPRMARMPRPGASVIEISDSLKITPPSTGSYWHSDGPSRSTLVITSALATARWTAAATLMLVSSMQPIMHSTWCSAQMSAMRMALDRPPVFISLMLMMSAARWRIRSITSVGPN